MKKDFTLYIYSVVVMLSISTILIGLRIDTLAKVVKEQQQLITQQQGIIDYKNFEIDRINAESSEVYHMFLQCHSQSE